MLHMYMHNAPKEQGKTKLLYFLQPVQSCVYA